METTLMTPHGILRCDGTYTAGETSDNEDNEDESEEDESNKSVYESDKKVDSEPTRAVLVLSNDNPGELGVETTDAVEAPTSLPLCVSLNARSI